MGVFPRPDRLLPGNRCRGVRSLAMAPAAQSLDRRSLDHRRPWLRAGWWDGCGDSGHGRADVDARVHPDRGGSGADRSAVRDLVRDGVASYLAVAGRHLGGPVVAWNQAPRPGGPARPVPAVACPRRGCCSGWRRANVMSFNLARDVMLGITFLLWTAWWIWLLVLLLRARSGAK